MVTTRHRLPRHLADGTAGADQADRIPPELLRVLRLTCHQDILPQTSVWTSRCPAQGWQLRTRDRCCHNMPTTWPAHRSRYGPRSSSTLILPAVLELNGQRDIGGTLAVVPGACAGTDTRANRQPRGPGVDRIYGAGRSYDFDRNLLGRDRTPTPARTAVVLKRRISVLRYLSAYAAALVHQGLHRGRLSGSPIRQRLLSASQKFGRLAAVDALSLKVAHRSS